MPQQAILDLPVLRFESYLEDPARLHADCIERYGLAGLAPHPDAVFHVAASLWRYRTDQSLAQVTGLATFFLKALSEAVASRRRLAALQAAGARQALLREAEEDLDFAQRDLAHLTRLVNQLTRALLELSRRNRDEALQQVETNLQEMASKTWSSDLERLARGLLVLDASRIDWTGALDEVLEALEDLAAGLPAADAGVSRTTAPPADQNQVLERLQAELRDYQSMANQASVRLRQIDRERRDLEAMLEQTRDGRSSRVEEIDRQRETLELTVTEARRRLQSLETRQGEELGRLREDNRRLRAENERLTNELLQAIAQSTEGEGETEELLEKIEEMDSQRLEAAAAIEQLSARLSGVQKESQAQAESTAAARSRVAVLQRSVDELGRELAESEARLTQAQATILALEDTAGRSTEFDAVLTDSEARLAETEARLVEAEARVEQLEHQLEDRDYRLGQLELRATAGKRTIDMLSGQLAESETLSSEHAARIRELERENERLRRDLSDTQTRMLDARGDMDEARDSERAARSELERLREELRAERSKSDKVRVDTGRIQDELSEANRRAQAAEGEAAGLRMQSAEVTALSERRKTEAEQAVAAARGLERRAKDAEERLARAVAEIADLRPRLAAAEGAAREAGASASSGLEAARNEATRAKSELESLRRAEQSAGEAAARLRSELAQVKSELAEVREESAAARDLLTEKLQRAEERAALAGERIRNGEAERKALAEANEAAEKARSTERDELEGVLARLRQDAASAAQSAAAAAKEMEAVKARLNESDTFVIAREREIEKQSARVKYLLAEIGNVADLRTRFEQATEEARRNELASQISRKLDSLFVEAGRRVPADRRTEKIVIMHVKKDAEQIASEAEKPFLATNEGEVSKPVKPSPRRKRDAQS